MSANFAVPTKPALVLGLQQIDQVAACVLELDRDHQTGIVWLAMKYNSAIFELVVFGLDIRGVKRCKCKAECELVPLPITRG